jgi:threonine dehydratase
VGRTFADGQQLASPGTRTWPVIDALADDVVTVTDEQVVDAMRLLFERLKVVAEPSGATALAALQAGGRHTRRQRVGAVLAGANIDAARCGADVAVVAMPAPIARSSCASARGSAVGAAALSASCARSARSCQ